MSFKPYHSEDTSRRTYEELSIFLLGMAAGNPNPEFAEKIKSASCLLSHAAKKMCGKGYFTCSGGPDCSSDHK